MVFLHRSKPFTTNTPCSKNHCATGFVMDGYHCLSNPTFCVATEFTNIFPLSTYKATFCSGFMVWVNCTSALRIIKVLL